MKSFAMIAALFAAASQAVLLQQEQAPITELSQVETDTEVTEHPPLIIHPHGPPPPHHIPPPHPCPHDDCCDHDGDYYSVRVEQKSV